MIHLHVFMPYNNSIVMIHRKTGYCVEFFTKPSQKRLPYKMDSIPQQVVVVPLLHIIGPHYLLSLTTTLSLVATTKPPHSLKAHPIIIKTLSLPILISHSNHHQTPVYFMHLEARMKLRSMKFSSTPSVRKTRTGSCSIWVSKMEFHRIL